MRLGSFKNHVTYDEKSFEQALNLSFEAKDANNTSLSFDVKTPQGSVVITDPTLEVVISLEARNPEHVGGGVIQWHPAPIHEE
jgi:hypothetical protein